MSAPLRLFGVEQRLAKAHRSGTHRSCTPAETLARFRPKAAQIGLTRLANVTGLDVVGLPVWVAIRPNARGLSTSQGKGLTHDAAKASALMESIETWHAEHIERPVVFDSAWSLARRANIIEVDGLSYYEDAPPRPDLPINWIEGYDLIQDAPCWVPLETVSTNYVVPARMNPAPTFVQSSNGLAGGNHVLEAVTHALAELIERDAVALGAAALRRLDGSIRVDEASVMDPDCRTVLDYLKRAGLTAAIYDLTSDLGIPTYACTILDNDDEVRWRTLPPFSGYGTHLTPGIALLRAVNEAVQSRLTYISGSRDDITPSEYRRGGNADDLASFRARLAAAPATLRFADRADLATDSFEGDITHMLDVLRAGGVRNAVVVDLSKPGMDVPVVKVVAPRLAAPVPLIKGRNIVTPGRTTLQQGVAA
jgi:ribosomal protein S12 methylthiotransferase accessory factor